MNAIHVLKRWPCSGGMEAIARLHLNANEPLLAFSGDTEQGVIQLGLTPRHSLRTAQARLHEALNLYHGSAIIAYNGYGLEWADFASPYTKGLSHAVFHYLHSDFPRLQPWLTRAAPHFSAGIFVNPALLTKLNASGKPWYPVPLPIQPPVAPRTSAKPSNPPRPGQPIRIGFAGRIQIAQKRLDRLPAFIRQLDAHSLSFEFDLLGEGDALEPLRAQFAGDPRIHFLGHLSGDNYWNRLHSWDFVVFLSDYEGLPIALLEAVHAGAVPIYPDFHAGNDWLSALAEDCLYPVGDVAAAAKQLVQIARNWPDSTWLAFHARAATTLQHHTPEAYLMALRGIIAEVPPSLPQPHARSLPAGLPLWFYHRWSKWQQFGWNALFSNSFRP